MLQWYDEAAPSVEYRDRELPRPALFPGMLVYAMHGYGNLSHAFSDAASSLRPDKLPATLSNGSVTNARRHPPLPYHSGLNDSHWGVPVSASFMVYRQPRGYSG
ncbi:MAG: hypothetical protein L6Q71_01015 [Planctomycetes bacterium]|nr:hypothetical protein [Planctomycetota bacterium]NUQ35502.1 hypothetical protein [Planctomycetaceae bacterium]